MEMEVDGPDKAEVGRSGGDGGKCQVSLLSHCIFCLRKTTEERKAMTLTTNPSLIEMLQLVPTAQLPFALSNSLSTLNKIWTSLQQQHNERDDCFESMELNATRPEKSMPFAQLPTMCQFCADKLEAVVRLYQDLMAEMKKLGRVIQESKYGGKYSWRAKDFERALKASSIERESVEATFQFLGKLGKESMDMNEDVMSSNTAVDTASTNQLEQDACSSFHENSRMAASPPLPSSPSPSTPESTYSEEPEETESMVDMEFVNAVKLDASDTTATINESEVSSDPIATEDSLYCGELLDPLAQSDADEYSGNEKEMDDEYNSDPDYIKSEEEEDDDVSTTSSESEQDKEDDEEFNISSFEVDEWGLLKKKPKLGRSGASSSNTASVKKVDPDKYIAQSLNQSTGDKIYTCTLDGCGAYYSCARNVRRHLRLVHKIGDNNGISCDQCGKSFTRRESLWHHKKVFHEGERMVGKICDLCKNIVLENNLYEHARAHVGDDYLIKCPNPNCPFTFCLPFAASKHIRSSKSCWDNTPKDHKLKETSSKNHRCEVCGFETHNSQIHSAHLQTHENDTKNFQCPIKGCQRRFTLKQSVTYHLSHHDFCRDLKSQRCVVCNIQIRRDAMEGHLKTSHQAKEIVKCHQCSFLFPTTELLIDHLFDHRYSELLCGICKVGVKFSTHAQLRAHYFDLHKIGQKFVCEYCEQVLWTQANLVQHKQRKHNGQEPSVKEKTIHKCNECDLEYKTAQGLSDHNIRAHGAEPFKCRFCGETFIIRAVFNRHVNEHRGVSVKPEKKFKCEEEGCGKVFSERRLLKRHHSVTHLGERPFACDLCEKSYTDPGSLKSHKESVHLGLRPYVCDACGESFTSGTVLKRHKLIHTGDRPFVCETCGQRFRQREVLNTHVEGHKRKGSDFKPNGPMKQNRKRVETKKTT